jgi:hypothetical protein
MPRALIDSVESGVARLVLEDAHTITLPAALLPEGAREGDWVALTLERTEPPESDREARRRKLTRNDDGGDFPL